MHYHRNSKNRTKRMAMLQSEGRSTEISKAFEARIPLTLLHSRGTFAETQARGRVLHTCYVMLEGCTLSQMLGMVNTALGIRGGGSGEHEAALCPLASSRNGIRLRALRCIFSRV